mgnify:CR=1 FL=1
MSVGTWETKESCRSVLPRKPHGLNSLSSHRPRPDSAFRPSMLGVGRWSQLCKAGRHEAPISRGSVVYGLRQGFLELCELRWTRRLSDRLTELVEGPSQSRESFGKFAILLANDNASGARY